MPTEMEMEISIYINYQINFYISFPCIRAIDYFGFDYNELVDWLIG